MNTLNDMDQEDLAAEVAWERKRFQNLMAHGDDPQWQDEE